MKINTGTYVEPTVTTLEEWVHRTWLPLIAERVKPSTLDSYRRNLDLHILTRLGQRQLRQITPAMLHQLYADLLSAGNLKTGAGLSAKTVRYVHTIIHKVLADAANLGLINVNVADRAKPPHPKAKASKEIKSWTADELRRFLELVNGHRLEAAWHLAALTGMRRAEVLGLRWRDLDMDSGRLSVRQALVSVGYEIIKSTPKTHQARTIDIDPGTVERLRLHRERQGRERDDWDADYQDNDLVFGREDGSPIHPHSFSQAFERIVARFGLPRIPLHGLRHTHATVALSLGVPAKVVSERLGHENVAFTLKQYAHVLPGMQAEAAGLIASMVLDQECEDVSDAT
ncbi:MAG: tyrosine-type recombinase/integrase [Acidimicrobiia bacterium]